MKIRILFAALISALILVLTGCACAPDCEAYCNGSGPYSCTTNRNTNPTICDGTISSCS